MKLLSLNIYAGKQGQPLFDYLGQEAKDTDIFCFQEVFKSQKSAPSSAVGRMSIYSELEELLPGHQGFFAQTSKNHDLENLVDFEVEAGMAMFIKKDLKVLGQESVEIFGNREVLVNPSQVNLSTGLQRADIAAFGKVLSVFNYHGIPFPGNKLDSAERLEHSKKISAVLETVKGPKILCGDFNLMPETQSIKILETGMRNLINECQITSTRNKISWEKYHNVQHFADFTFVSPDIKIQNFSVPYNEVSDHLPMLLEFLVSDHI